MKNELNIKVRMLNDKQIKKGNWEIRVWNLFKEYFDFDHWVLSWNPSADWEPAEDRLK